MRLSGLSSGMDTEGIVAQMMKAQRMKSTKIQNKITTAEWKQDIWKDLNSKIYSFYTGALSKMRMQGSFAVKKATSSNEQKLQINAGSSAPVGTHLVKVKQMASSQFVTGAKITKEDGGQVSGSTKLTELGFSASEGTTITINSGSKKVELNVRANTTVNDLTAAMKNAGLNANFDASQQRLFISSKESGSENAFSITSSSTAANRDKNEILDFLGYDSLKSDVRNQINSQLKNYASMNSEDQLKVRDKLAEIKHQQVKDQYVKDYMSDQNNVEAVRIEERARLEENLPEGETLDDKVLDAAVRSKLEERGRLYAEEKYTEWKNNPEAENEFKSAIGQLDILLEKYALSDNTSVPQSGKLSSLGLGEVQVVDGKAVISDAAAGIAVVQAADAEIIYNGALLTSSGNNFTVNGLQFTLKGVTAGLNTEDPSDDEEISLSVSDDAQGVYDMVKDFVKTYNELLKEMNEMYNAKNAKSYNPLTDDEKAVMTDGQIDKWEKTIQDALLRRDETLSGLISMMRGIATETVVVDGKSYSLSSFGISPTDYREKGTLHINGDQDDSGVAHLTDKLMKAIMEDPETVTKVLTGIAQKLHDAMSEKSRSTTLSSALTFYNDKDMEKGLKQNKTDLNKLELKLQQIENKYYKQFAAMEKAMSQMNSQSASLMSMMGMNQQNNNNR